MSASHTKITVPVFITPTTDIRVSLQTAAESGADLIELRCDNAPEAAMLEAIRLSPRPVVVTVRAPWEGGQSNRTDDERAALLVTAAQAQPAYLDVELLTLTRLPALQDALAPYCGAGKTQLIVSNHDFEKMPSDLAQRLDRMAALKFADILKVAFMPATVADAVTTLRLSHEGLSRWGKPVVALAMGPKGQISRLLGAKFNQPLTFAALNAKAQSAPGQPTVHEMIERYRFREQRVNTAVCGVIGWPVGHSLSPHVHNAGFRETHFDGVYVPLPIEPSYEEFSAVVDALATCPDMHLRGLSVTIPHKENALRYVRERGGVVEDLAAHIGAVNTIVFPEADADRTLRGLNSDYPGALDALARAMHVAREDLASRRVAVIGAGGAARAIVAGLAHYGATTVIYNRTFENAQSLANEFNGKTGKVVPARLEKLCDSCCDIWINCTPLGMHPKIEGCPVPESVNWGRDTVVFDTVYNPLYTRFLKLAQEKGATVVPGTEMFVGQAVVQYERFTGHAAPVQVFRDVLLHELNARQAS